MTMRFQISVIIWSLLSLGGVTTELPNSIVSDILSRYPGQDDYVVPTEYVSSVVGGEANLHCNLTSPVEGDRALLVLWYKEGIHKPIYSYDIRNDPPTHWKNPAHTGPKVAFDTFQSSLVLRRVTAKDNGIYRCRMDFRTNPTLEYIANLTVIVPPRRLAIYTSRNMEAQSIVGPYNEGDDVRLTCLASGGSPPPKITWWEGVSVLDEDSEVISSEQVANTLVIKNLGRRHLYRVITCQASNSNLTDPLFATISIDMKFPPLWVRLLTNHDPLSAEREYVVSCQTAGARPSARITWALGSSILTTHSETTSHEGNVTTSELHWKPTVGDAGKVLQCRADSPAVTRSPPMVDDWLLDIYYVPVTTLHPGRSLNLSNIEEGDDVYFECSIKSNPWVYKIVFFHEGHELRHNVSAGIIISNQSLVLQKIARTASGNYYCVTSNIEGDGRSNPIHLNVKYTPVCRPGQMMYHGAARFEQVNIPCHLDAHPQPLAFTWTFNNSGESVEIPKSHIRVVGAYSTVSYTPNTELDYGTLLCWGTNAVGKQKQPCVFHVFPAGLPDPVHNCSVYNLSVDIVHLRCAAGFDGGLQQTFILELYEPHTNKLVANTSNGVPTFSVPGLPPGMSFTGVVYSTNAKGKGEQISLPVYTIKDIAERRTAAVKPSPKDTRSPSAPLSFKPILALVLGVVGGLMIVAVVICAVVRFHQNRRTRQRAESGSGSGDGEGRGGGVSVSVGGGRVECRHEPCEGLHESVAACHGKKLCASLLKEVPPPPTSPKDADNPDVIPLSDSDSWPNEGVTTISSATLPSSYSTLPPSAHLYSQSSYQVCPGNEMSYTELMMCGPNTNSAAAAGVPTAPSGRQHHQRDSQQRVGYATLDHKHLCSSSYPHQRQPYSLSSSANNSPKHTSSSLLPHQSPSTHGLFHQEMPLPPPPHNRGRPKSVTWAQTSTLGRRHSLRRDPGGYHDPDCNLPLMPNQKESSV